MSFILGFGSTEVEERQKIKDAINASDLPINDVLEQWNSKAKEYDEMPRGQAPQRYTSVSYYGGELHFMHINREHALSPDGWACWQIDEPFTREIGDES